jgi:hypothetical protein
MLVAMPTAEPDVRTDLRPVCAAVVLVGIGLGWFFGNVLITVLWAVNALWATPPTVFVLSGTILSQKTTLRRARVLDLRDASSVWNTGRAYGVELRDTRGTSIEITCWLRGTRRLRRAIGVRLVEAGRGPETRANPDRWAWKMLGIALAAP